MFRSPLPQALDGVANDLAVDRACAAIAFNLNVSGDPKDGTLDQAISISVDREYRACCHRGK